MKKRVAIMTWYKYYNYGTALQCTALYNTIKNLDYDVDVINYNPRKNRNYSCDKIYSSVFRTVLSKAKEIISPTNIPQERKALYNSFLLNNITETLPCRSYPELNDLNNVYDAFVCGSDQIWSPLVFDDKYFLSFVDISEKMIAYAPSMGNNKIDDEHLKSEITKNIRRFLNLSVRENEGRKLIKNLTGKSADIVLDPTLLLSGTDWDAFVSSQNEKKLPEKDYIICYFLGNPQKYSRYVARLSSKTGIPYYVIPVKRNQHKSSHKVPFEVGPEEFISLIKNAHYVCTDSFHGMAFSIIYNTPFTAFKRFSDNDINNQNSRLTDLLEILGLNDRLINVKTKYEFSEFDRCSFDKSNAILADLRNKSIDYLRHSLETATKPVPDNYKSFKVTDICCGCGACSAVCPTGAISISKNKYGFEHYKISEDKCVKCGKCKTVCPMTNIESKDIENANGLYSVKNNSEQAIKASSTAGVGYAITQYGAKNGFYISGCIYDVESSTAKHILISPEENKDKLIMLQGSKYIQSITADCMKEINALDADEKLIFFGTPCQVAAVRKLINKKSMKNVVLVDLICHGVPSYHLWKKYIEDIDSKHNIGKKPIVAFRDKTSDWHRRCIKLKGNGNVYLNTEKKDDFYAFFRRGICDMRACSDCPYREKSSADIRIGDYWGKKFQNSKNPVSMVITNTYVGDEILNSLKKENCIIEKQRLEEYWQIQAPYNLKQSLYHNEVIKALQNQTMPLHKLRKKYCGYYDILEFFERLRAKINK